MRTLLRHAKEPSVEIGLREFIADAESRLEPINNCDAERACALAVGPPKVVMRFFNRYRFAPPETNYKFAF